MRTKLLKIATMAALATAALAAGTAQAQVAGVKSIVITNARVSSSPPTADDYNLRYIQVGDVSALQAVTFQNVAHAINGATASAFDVYDPALSTPDKAIDENLSSNYADGIYHSSNSANASLTISLAGPSDLRNLSIIGRSGGFDARDYYSYTLLGADGGTLKTGILDNRGLNGASNLVSFVPEPAVWAMMIIGFGVVGGAMRRRNAVAGPAFA